MRRRAARSRGAPAIPLLIVLVEISSCTEPSRYDNRKIVVTLEFYSQWCIDCGPGIRGNPYGYTYTVDGGAQRPSQPTGRVGCPDRFRMEVIP